MVAEMTCDVASTAFNLVSNQRRLRISAFANHSLLAPVAWRGHVWLSYQCPRLEPSVANVAAAQPMWRNSALSAYGLWRHGQWRGVADISPCHQNMWPGVTWRIVVAVCVSVALWLFGVMAYWPCVLSML